MTAQRGEWLRTIAVAVVVLIPVLAQAMQTEEVGSAAQLYEQAKYDDALVILDRLKDPSPDGAVRPGQDLVAEYRALCLMALGRLPEAEQALEPLLLRKPLYEPQSGEVPPRFVNLLTSIRTRIFPAAIRARYRAARASYDAGDRAEAEQGFRDVVLWSERPELNLDARGALEDVAVLAQEFLTVIAAKPAASSPATANSTSTMPGTPSGAGTVAAPPAPPAGADTDGKSEQASASFGPDDPDVEPAQTLSRTVPPWPPSLGRVPDEAKRVILELVVSATGQVESVQLIGSVHPLYDRLLIQAARSWRFRPATRAGVPVRFRKPVLVTVTPEPRKGSL